jgi:two-component SAPR family response regulator
MLFRARQLIREHGVDPDEVLVSTPQIVRFLPDTVSVDAVEIVRLFREAEEQLDPSSRRRALARALTLYRGELLRGVDAPWAEAERLQLAESFRIATRSLVALHEAAGKTDDALSVARFAMSIDATDSEMRDTEARIVAAIAKRAQQPHHRS